MALTPVRPSSLPRAAAVQRADQPPTRALMTGTGTVSRGGGFDDKFLQGYMGWQDWARRYAARMGVARFAAGITADTCARCILRVEERDPNGDWGETEDQRLVGIFDAYRNDRQESGELVRAHAWHYSVAGECAQVVTDGRLGPDWWIYSMRAIEWRNATKQYPAGSALVKAVPGGTVKAGTAMEVPRENVVRFWIPDEEWQALATSPMAASIDDLHRYWSLSRMVRRTADSALAMRGVLHTPLEAHEDDPQNPDGPSLLERQFYEMAQRAFSDDDDVLAVAPPLTKWANDLGPPEWVKLSEGLDPEGIPYRKEALEDFARGTNLPASLVVGGGPGDANHWTEWLVDDKFFESAVAPTMDRVSHSDLTATFLVPVLRQLRLPEDRFRVGYDAGPVIVRADQSDQALRLHLAGLLSGEATLEAANFDPDQAMSAEEFDRLLQLLAKDQGQPAPGAAGGGVPVGPATTVQGPPPQPQGLRAAAEPAAGDPAVEQRARARVFLARLAAIRRDTGRRLLAGAEVAFESALTRAGTKIAVRARNRRASAEVREQVLAAVDYDGEKVPRLTAPLGPWLAAVGITEAEALDRAFTDYKRNAERALVKARAEQEKAARAAGYDPAVVLEDDHSDVAAAFLAAALLALAYQRLTEGPSPTPLGEVTGSVPAQVVTRALKVAEGSLTPTRPESPGVMPSVMPVEDYQSPVDAIGLDSSGDGGGVVLYEWVHGFYGDPERPFDPHAQLGLEGFQTEDRFGDPRLAEDVEDWTDEEINQPGDHGGCTCEWVEVVAEPRQQESVLPGPDVPGLPSAADIANGAFRRAASAGGAMQADQVREDDGKFGGSDGSTPEKPETDPKDPAEGISAELQAEFPGVDFVLSDTSRDGVVTLSKVVVPKDERGGGTGSQFMGALTAKADAVGARIELTPSKDFGATSVGRLTEFYKGFGFVSNSGRNKDYETRETMYRDPQPVG